MTTNSRKRLRADSESFDDYGSDRPKRVIKKSFSPRINLYEHTDSKMMTATFELPGLKREDIFINLLHDKLTIAGESLDQQPQGEGTYTIRGLPCGGFSRVLTMPLGMRAEDFKARMENGLLILTFPKDPPRQEPRRIPIE